MFFTKKDEIKELKKWHVIVLVAMLVATIGLRIYYARWPKAKIVVGGQPLTVLVADTFQRRVEGWSDKKRMGNYDGMLFVFSEKGEHTMVMRDMYFSLDILWVDEGKIVDIAANAQPERGRLEEGLTPYIPRAPATLVIELPAGFVEKNGVKIGDSITILD